MQERFGLRHVGALAMLVSILGCVTAAVPSDNPESGPLKQVADVPLPGPAVRFDYQSLGSRGRSWPVMADSLRFSLTSQGMIAAAPIRTAIPL